MGQWIFQLILASFQVWDLHGQGSGCSLRIASRRDRWGPDAHWTKYLKASSFSSTVGEMVADVCSKSQCPKRSERRHKFLHRAGRPRHPRVSRSCPVGCKRTWLQQPSNKFHGWTEGKLSFTPCAWLSRKHEDSDFS